MNIHHFFLLWGLFVDLGQSVPTLPQALARLSEARTRTLSNRARARINSARIINQARRSSIGRQKRQDFTDMELPEDLPVFVMDDTNEHPEFEGSILSQTGPSDDLDEEIESILARNQGIIRDIEAQNRRLRLHHHAEEAKPRSADNDLQEQLQDILERNREFWERVREANVPHIDHNHHVDDHLNPKSFNNQQIEDQPRHLNPEIQDQQLNREVEDLIGKNSQLLHELRQVEDSSEDTEKSAEPHLHGAHQHSHTSFHSHSFGTNPGFVPQNNQGLNLNINQNQQGFVPNSFPSGHFQGGGANIHQNQAINQHQGFPHHFQGGQISQNQVANQFASGFPHEGFLGEAQPDFLQPEEPTFDPFNQREYVSDFLDGHQFRSASPTFHHHKKMKKTKKFQQPYYNSGYSRGADHEDPLLKNIINVPENRDNSYNVYKRHILGQERQLVDSLKNNSTDEDLKFIGLLGDRILSDLEGKTNKSPIKKRSLPLRRLITDPNARLDVSKTIENFGTATRNAFESDDKHPIFHVKHLMGNSKNAVLSAMKIPPQNMIIPSDYEIVKNNNLLLLPRSRKLRKSEDDPLNFSGTFSRMGEIIRDSIKSGQETAAHIGNIAHDARKIIHTSRHSATPRFVIPYSQVPAIERDALPKKTILITPRILNVADDNSLVVGSPPNESRFVKLGQLMDAVGISDPNTDRLDLQKIIFESKRNDKLYNKFRKDTVGNAVNTLEDVRVSVGAKDLRDFILKMKEELTSALTPRPRTRKDKELEKFAENLFDGKHEINQQDPVVGSGLFLSPELLHPFMGRVSGSDLHDYLRISEDHHKKSDEVDIGNRMLEPREDSGSVLGAINPIMFERLSNQTLRMKPPGDDVENLGAAFGKPLQDGSHVDDGKAEGDQVGTFMTLSESMKEPFMGRVSPEALGEFYGQFNGGHSEEEAVSGDEISGEN